MGSWLLKTSLKRQKSTNQPTNKKEQKNKINGKYNTYHGLLSHQRVDVRYQS